MINKLFSCVVAGALGATVALTSPVQARGGGSMGGGMHAGGMGGGTHFGAMGGGMHFGGSRFAGAHFVHPGFPSRFSRFAFETVDFSAMIALLS